MAADNAQPKTPRETADSDSDSDGARHRAAAVHALDVYEGFGEAAARGPAAHAVRAASRAALLRSACAHLEAGAASGDADALALLRFEVAHASEFDPAAAAAGEHPLRHTELHAEYAALVEARLLAFARARGVSDEGFADAVRRGVAAHAADDADADARAAARWAKRLLELIERASDFGAFADAMAAAHAQRLDAGIGPGFKKKKQPPAEAKRPDAPAPRPPGAQPPRERDEDRWARLRARAAHGGEGEPRAEAKADRARARNAK